MLDILGYGLLVLGLLLLLFGLLGGPSAQEILIVSAVGLSSAGAALLLRARNQGMGRLR